MCGLTLHSSISSTKLASLSSSFVVLIEPRQTCKLKLNLANLSPALDVPKMVEHLAQGWSLSGLEDPIQNKEEPKLLHHFRHMERKGPCKFLLTWPTNLANLCSSQLIHVANQPFTHQSAAQGDRSVPRISWIAWFL